MTELNVDEKIEKKINKLYQYSPTYLQELEDNLKKINDLVEDYLESSPSLLHEDRKLILSVNFEADELKTMLYEASFYSEQIVKNIRNAVLNNKKEVNKENQKQAEIVKKIIKEYEKRAPELFSNLRKHIKKMRKIY